METGKAPTLPEKCIPSYHGKDCLGDGKHEGYECCCDECNYYLECFPDWRDGGLDDGTI